MTPLDISVEIKWHDETSFEVIIKPIDKSLKDWEWRKYGVIIPEKELDQDKYPNNFIKTEDAVKKWTIEDSDILKDTEFVKYWVDQMNQALGTDYILGKITET